MKILMSVSNYSVTLEGAWVVKSVKDVDDAISIAISEAGKRINPKLDFVEMSIGHTLCPSCGESLDSVFLIGRTALVGLTFELKIFDVENEGHAVKIAKSMVGNALKNIPLSLLHVEPA